MTEMLATSALTILVSPAELELDFQASVQLRHAVRRELDVHDRVLRP